MKKNLISLAFLIFSLVNVSTAFAKPRLAILSWQENTNLLVTGKSSEISAQGKVTDFLPNQLMTSFTISFDPRRSIKIYQVTCDGRPADYSFKNNSLSIKFPSEKPNNAGVSFYFSYVETYQEINQFLRQEAITIPPFAAGANAQVIINFPGFLESTTLNPNLTKSGNSFVYNRVVPQSGVEEIIKLTDAAGVWNIDVKIKISASSALKNTTVTMPNYFKNGGQKVENFIIKSSVNPLGHSFGNDNKILKFNSDQNEILIENIARISTGKNNRTRIERNPFNYLNISSEEQILLTPILEKIKQDPKYARLPLHAKIGEFVHNFITYDISYINKLPKLTEILQNPTGVCTEYSKLYNALARLAKIPSIVVEGAACGEYQKCNGHTWNMIYLNNEWISVDPTWNLMSGVISSSHVYFNDSVKNEVVVEYLDDKKTISSKIDFEMTQGN